MELSLKLTHKVRFQTTKITFQQDNIITFLTLKKQHDLYVVLEVSFLQQIPFSLSAPNHIHNQWNSVVFCLKLFQIHSCANFIFQFLQQQLCTLISSFQSEEESMIFHFPNYSSRSSNYFPSNIIREKTGLLSPAVIL